MLPGGIIPFAAGEVDPLLLATGSDTAFLGPNPNLKEVKPFGLRII
jgi:hypothetical protein